MELVGFGSREEYVAEGKKKIGEAEECWQPEKMKQRNAKALIGLLLKPSGVVDGEKPSCRWQQGQGARGRESVEVKSQNVLKILPQEAQAKPAHVALTPSPGRWGHPVPSLALGRE